MESTNIIPIYIEEEMRSSYMDYAMSVIISRALPDVRDGLKPVHRRILYAMLSEGLTSGRKFSKCAGVVGEVLKKYHPHGDSAVYGALVRLAQPWALRYPLIDGQGNFGSVDGDSAAAYRYTECRMKQLAEFLLSDIEKDTVDFSPNFDDTTEEPRVLPSRVPNLLINGAEGIAVGMASSIPPHNLREVIEGTIRLINNPEISIDELMESIPAPDFPTGGIIYGSLPCKQVYRTGKAIVKLRSKVHTEILKGGRSEVEAIVVDEIPYQVNKARLVEKIAELVNEKKIEGIARLRDESDRQGMRVVIELKRNTESEVVLNQLYKMSPLETSYGMTMRAIVDGSPRILNLKEILQSFVDHRRVVITRRTHFELDKARARLHILEGLRIALANIDEVIAVIRNAESTPDAKNELMARFALSDIQAQHILDMPLKRLTGLERKAIEDEYQELVALVEKLMQILSDGKEVDNIVVSELTEISEKFGDARRTSIEHFAEDIDFEDLIAEEEMVVTVSHRGYIKRCSASLFKAQNRGGKGVMGSKKLTDEDEDFIQEIFVASTHAYLLVFTSKGKIHWIKVYQIPETGKTARGRAIVNMLALDAGERITAILPVRRFEDDKKVVMVTRKGVIKRVDLMDFSNVRAAGIKAAQLDDGDELIGVLLSSGQEDVLLSTASGMSIRFPQSDVRVMGRAAHGVRAIKLDDLDVVVSSALVPLVDEEAQEETQEEEQEQSPEPVEPVSEEEEGAVSAAPEVEPKGVALLTVCENGYGKRTLVKEYRVQSRGGWGIIDIKTDGRNGPVVGTCEVESANQLMIITNTGRVIRIPVRGISLRGRNTMGVRLINLESGEKVASIARLAAADPDDDLEDEVDGEEKE